MYVPHRRKIVSSYDVVFDGSFSSALAYTSQPNVETMYMQTAVSYMSNAASPKEKTGNIITFSLFEEGDLLSETRHSTESGKKSDKD